MVKEWSAMVYEICEKKWTVEGIETTSHGWQSLGSATSVHQIFARCTANIWQCKKFEKKIKIFFENFFKFKRWYWIERNKQMIRG